MVEDHGEVKGNDGKEVDKVHGVHEKAPLPGTTDKSDGVFKREKDDRSRVNSLQDLDGDWVLGFVLQVRKGLQDKGEG